MAWVFLTEQHAYKLKKPVCYPYLDFSTLEARRDDCQREVLLNRRLASGVYYGAVPLAVDSLGALHIDRPGSAVDWLVKMRRLPSERMLDRALREKTAEEADVRRVGELLGRFYRAAPTIALDPDEYCRRLESAIRENHSELISPAFGLRSQPVSRVAKDQLRFVDKQAHLLRARVEAGRIVDAHGDLRPEHVCLEDPPVIIDCLEFNRDFRILDTASELSFLTLECDRLGGFSASDLLWTAYVRETGDRCPEVLRRFYRSYHALTRAKIAIWHLRDGDVVKPDSWRPKTEQYLDLAAEALD